MLINLTGENAEEEIKEAIDRVCKGPFIAVTDDHCEQALEDLYRINQKEK